MQRFPSVELVFADASHRARIGKRWLHRSTLAPHQRLPIASHKPGETQNSLAHLAWKIRKAAAIFNHLEVRLPGEVCGVKLRVRFAVELHQSVALSLNQ